MKDSHEREAKALKGIIIDREKAVDDIKNERESDLKNQLEELEQIRQKYAEVTKYRPPAPDPRTMISISDQSKDLVTSFLTMK